MTYTRQLATAVNCSYALSAGPPEILRCLKQKSWEELLSADVRAPKYYSAFGPVVDGHSFLPSAITDGMARGDQGSFDTTFLRGRGPFGSTTLLAGVMKSEGLIFLNQSQLENGISQLTREQVIQMCN